jgi:hypothetical protein
MTRLEKLSWRIAFCAFLLALNYFRVKLYLLADPPENGGEQFAAGMLLMLDGFISLSILCPLTFGLWAAGFHDFRFRKTVLAAGLLTTGWTTLLVSALLASTLMAGEH